MNETELLKQQIVELLNWKKQMEASFSIPLNIDQALTGRGFVKSNGNPLNVVSGGTGTNSLTGILKGNGTSAFTTITPLSGVKVYYVSDSSGGAVTRKLTFNSGILTSET